MVTETNPLMNLWMRHGLRPEPVVRTLARCRRIATALELELLPITADARLDHIYAAVPRDASRVEMAANRLVLGAGVSPAHAQMAAVGTIVERWSRLPQGGETVIRASYRALGTAAIHPNDCMLFSPAQLSEHRPVMGKAADNWAPLPLKENRLLAWTPVYSLMTGDHHYLPTAYLYPNYDDPAARRCVRAAARGTAAGSSVPEAILFAFLELIECDAVNIWWHNRLHRPAVKLDTIAGRYVGQLYDAYRRAGRHFWLLDLTTDADIPAYVALSQRDHEPAGETILGSGAHLNPHIAVVQALLDLNRHLPEVRRRARRAIGLASPVAAPRDTRPTVGDLSFLQPLPDQTVSLRKHPAPVAETLDDAVQYCVTKAAQLGMKTFVLDLSRPQTGLSVVRVVVPGLRTAPGRYAPGRLYDVPVRMGWRRRPLEETALNRLPLGRES